MSDKPKKVFQWHGWEIADRVERHCDGYSERLFVEYSAYGDAMEHLAAMVHAPDSQCFSEARVRAEQFLKSCNGEDK